MNSPIQIYDYQLALAVQNGQITSDQASHKKSNVIVKSLLWIAELSPMVTAIIALFYTVVYFIGIDPINIINSSIIKLIINILNIFCVFIIILSVLYKNIFVTVIQEIIVLS